MDGHPFNNVVLPTQTLKLLNDGEEFKAFEDN